VDCEYILVYRMGRGSRNEFSHKFHATTLKEARERAQELIKHYQAENVRKFPFAPVVVAGELYRQIQELDGEKFIKTADGRSYADSLSKSTIL